MTVEYKDGFAIVTMPAFRTRHKLPADEFRRQKEFAERMLAQHRDYLSANERYEMRMVAKEEGCLLSVKMESTERRITDLANAGVPPVFLEAFEGATRSGPFPVIDFVLEFVSGRYFKIAAVLGIKRKKGIVNRYDSVIRPALPTDVRDFRTRAFDGEKICPQLYREISNYIREHFNIPSDRAEEIAIHDQIVLKFLESALCGFPPGERVYSQYSEGEPLDFISKRMWYLSFSPEDRVRIVRDFVKRLREKESDLMKRNLLTRMAALFPDEIDLDELRLERLRLEKMIDDCEKLQDFTNMPEILLTDPNYGGRYVSLLKEHVRRKCTELSSSDPKALFTNLGFMPPLLLIPQGSQFIPDFRDVITAARLEAAMGMPDADFSDYFRNHGRVASIGHSQRMCYSLIDIRFRDYLLGRVRDLALPYSMAGEDLD